MYPIRFKPIYRSYPWGGNRFATHFQRDVKKAAESWEIVDQEGAMSVVVNGPWKGKTLHQLVKEMGEDLLGVGAKWERFPLLFKIVDAQEDLSLQVHPDAQRSESAGGQAKTEGWFILEPCSIRAALKKGVDEKAFRKAIEKKKAEELVELWEMKKGEVAFIPAGRVHALCAGAFLVSVQQNSNTTYRLYDTSEQGKELQLKEGLQSIHWGDQGHVKATFQNLSSDLRHQLVILLSTPFFVIDRIDIFNGHHLAAIPKTFQIIFCTQGKGELCVDGHKEPLMPGMTYLIPAAAKSIDIEGRCQILRVRLP